VLDGARAVRYRVKDIERIEQGSSPFLLVLPCLLAMTI
jgi:hypothetical protein